MEATASIDVLRPPLESAFAMNVQIQPHLAVAKRLLLFECVALVLQGGGALGAYQAGVYEALAEAKIDLDWGSVTPFALASGDQFRPPGPPDLTSAEYAAALEDMKRLGSTTSTERTGDQTEIALFWADGPGSYTPPGHWNQIATEIAGSEEISGRDSALMLAELNVALADAGVAAWDAKYTYGSWRPITAVQLADTDGNEAATADPDWSPLLTTPNHPDYVSGHSTFSGAAAEVLTDFFGDICQASHATLIVLPRQSTRQVAAAFTRAFTLSSRT